MNALGMIVIRVTDFSECYAYIQYNQDVWQI